MKSAEYLYDCTGARFRELSYLDALRYKITHAYSLLGKLREEAKTHLHEPEKYAVLLKRYQDVEKAIHFNNKLIEELE